MLAASHISRKLKNFQHSQNPRQNPYLYQQVSKTETQPAPACRSTGRSTDPSTGRPGAQQRVGYLQSGFSVDRAVDRSLTLCTLCTCGRPGRSTAEPVLLLLLSSAAVSLHLRRRLPRRSLDDPSTIHVNFLSNILSFQQV